ncbi:putative endo-beta-1,4-glucanase D OS=Neosartorya fumigata (strain ATCC MYA-4609 / Af293 / CBS 101355 / FGSC A1100) GN=eglD PE=3 SV=1 [Rhizoctonia solani AG-1 IB]|uniref:lytic cellulose monooxygenase (C4-dehydrogenating) n=1 Tax=Thanatephorus cucumeris (strain AG1-IB / isolate 7/3/14) TaxID=1108050 RepID=A0A0B7FR72_THACB|nr:putative endo-beta-1,4-glucanase D OS=Neosartorya fumigata (strain ATCC MYA-4609 / Af293 / CBS 101355 / FGSC A1100) GN=eglD PE=3 SV=1 [Rhizoctonia solani AG-1 IB]
MLAQVAIGLLSVASSVLAHGFAVELTVSNPPATYTAFDPYQDVYKNPVPDRITRKIPGNGPVEDITSMDIQCNGGGTAPAALIGTAAAGSNIGFNWTAQWPSSHMGPVITYMAKAPSDITKWTPGTDKVWFKIDEAGLVNGKWAGTDILLEQNGLWTVKVPENLQPGQYLIRHEIIALHAAGSYPGAQFYPACHQFEITGSGTALPDDADLVAFPGAYTPETPGVVYNPYNGQTTYPIPGPKVWNGSGSGSGNGGSGASSAVAAPSSTVAASSTAAAPSSAAEATSVATEAPSSQVPEAPSSSAEVPVSSTEVPASSTAAPVSSSAAPVSTTVAVPVSSTLAPSTPTPGAGGAAQLYAQCGGANFNGPKACAAPYTCKEWNPYYSQCIQA